MRRFATRLSAVALIATLAGCGAPSRRHPASPHPVRSVRVCSGLTDSCRTLELRPTLALQSPRGRIPDVSSFQGHPDWAAAKAAGIAGAIFKGGEFQVDPDAAFNASELRRLRIWHAMYWFVRNTGCSHEAAQIIALAHFFQVKVVVNDLEVPEAAGYGACLVPAERHAGLIPVDYTAPGTFPGGGFGLAPLWQAEYGPTLHPFWHPVVAWQCTDGRFGCVTAVPGIGVDDVSINLGITRLGAPPARPVCFGPHAQLRNRTCETVRPALARWSRARDATARALANVNHGLSANHCRIPYRRDVCVDLGREIAPVLRRREHAYAAKVTATIKEYS